MNNNTNNNPTTFEGSFWVRDANSGEVNWETRWVRANNREEAKRLFEAQEGLDVEFTGLRD